VGATGTSWVRLNRRAYLSSVNICTPQRRGQRPAASRRRDGDRAHIGVHVCSVTVGVGRSSGGSAPGRTRGAYDGDVSEQATGVTAVVEPPLSRAARKERTRQALLDAGLRLAADHTLAAVSLRHIAREVGIVPTAFYRHFD